MSSWNWNGARWWKFDFHTHTPASEDYGKGSHQAQLRSRTPREWLLDFMRAGVDCVAITDHNSGAWVDPLKEELRRDKPRKASPNCIYSPASRSPSAVECMSWHCSTRTRLPRRLPHCSGQWV